MATGPGDASRPIASRIEGVPGWVAPHWRVELFDFADGSRLSHPLGVAYVTEYPPPVGPVLDYLIVYDHHRGRGHAGTLVRHCHARWPGIKHTGRLEPDGTWRGE
jgi:hypothetical protein